MNVEFITYKNNVVIPRDNHESINRYVQIRKSNIVVMSSRGSEVQQLANQMDDYFLKNNGRCLRLYW